MHSMAEEGNFPKVFGRTNRQGTPFVAMFVTAAFNMTLIFIGSIPAILAAAAIGYTCANGISLFAYVKSKTSPAFANLERPFKAPRGWKYVALVFGLFNVPLCLIGVVYLNSLEIGWTSTWLGFVVLAVFIPIWLYTQHQSRSGEDKSDETSPSPHSLLTNELGQSPGSRNAAQISADVRTSRPWSRTPAGPTRHLRQERYLHRSVTAAYTWRPD